MHKVVNDELNAICETFSQENLANGSALIKKRHSFFQLYHFSADFAREKKEISTHIKGLHSVNGNVENESGLLYNSHSLTIIKKGKPIMTYLFSSYLSNGRLNEPISIRFPSGSAI